MGFRRGAFRAPLLARVRVSVFPVGNLRGTEAAVPLPNSVVLPPSVPSATTRIMDTL